jgi:hypothetical protein
MKASYRSLDSGHTDRGEVGRLSMADVDGHHTPDRDSTNDAAHVLGLDPASYSVAAQIASDWLWLSEAKARRFAVIRQWRQPALCAEVLAIHDAPRPPRIRLA